MNTLFMNSEESKISDCYRLLINLQDKINLNKGSKYAALSNVSRIYMKK